MGQHLWRKSRRIFRSNPVSRRWCLGMSCGSKVPSRSRGVVSLISPRSPCTVFCECPLRRFLLSSWKCLGSGVHRGLCRRIRHRPRQSLASETGIQLGIQHAFQRRLRHQFDEAVEVLQRLRLSRDLGREAVQPASKSHPCDNLRKESKIGRNIRFPTLTQYFLQAPLKTRGGQRCEMDCLFQTL